MMSMKLEDIAILKIKNADYRWIISGMNKIEAIKLLQNIDFTKKSGAIYKAFKEKYQKKFLKL